MSLRPELRPAGVALMACGLALAACGDPVGERPPILLVVIDTLRRDALGCYGGAEAQTPHLDALAARGARFDAAMAVSSWTVPTVQEETAMAVSSWTVPTVASILTGRYPDELGIADMHDPLPDHVPTLAERLAEAGYATAAVVSNGLAGPAFGHARGYRDFHFEPYRVPTEAGLSRPSFAADRVSDRALELLEALSDAGGPFFLHLHYTDPHAPYLAPPEWRERLLEGHPRFDETLLHEEGFESAPLSAEQRSFLWRAYLAEVAFVDHELGRVLRAFPEEGFIVVVSDHGEEFLEHQGLQHGYTLYQEVVEVPLLMAGPGVPAGAEVLQPVSQVEIAPTILAAAGIGEEEAGDRGLWDALAGRPAEPTPIFSVLSKRELSWSAVRRGRLKLHHWRERGTHLFDLGSDPDERFDLAGRQPEQAARLRRLLEERRADLSPPQRLPDPAGDDERREALRALGYVE